LQRSHETGIHLVLVVGERLERGRGQHPLLHVVGARAEKTGRQRTPDRERPHLDYTSPRVVGHRPWRRRHVVGVAGRRRGDLLVVIGLALLVVVLAAGLG
jgi:hypothetical protein